ncbi:hypothetical protein WSS_A15184 [Rhodococcus opacus M213]|uniref:Uncharacterized protein n=1 Tax=Rhodococcus opacus M213 TaxID=1129896 RepID=K8XUJ4_RHOOP|nr:hypothetical protein [Rhodococcus opacus]EKT81847.1 hypothetical protein WSS_A15184 [Rhodococcus opacus M213]
MPQTFPADSVTPPEWYTSDSRCNQEFDTDHQGRKTVKWVRDFAPEGADFSVELFCIDTVNEDDTTDRSIDYIVTVGTYPPEVAGLAEKAQTEAWAAKRP